jgi:hypothetical protein
MGECQENNARRKPEPEQQISFIKAVQDMYAFAMPMAHDELKEAWHNLSHKTAHEFGANAGTQLLARLATTDAADDIYNA